jgi:hypothetical protein
MDLRHATELAARLRSVVTNGPSPTTCLRWIKREQAVPAWALLAAAQAAEMSVDALLGQLETRRLLNELAAIEQRLEALERSRAEGSLGHDADTKTQVDGAD